MSEAQPENLPALRGQITPTGLKLPPDLTFEEWEKQGEVLMWLYEWTPWAIADWLNQGEKRYGETYVQASKITGRAIKTLYNLSYLGREFPQEMRSKVLTPTHHDVLTGMPEDEKRRWLAEGERLEAESNGHLTVKAFREHVAENRREQGSSKAEVVRETRRCMSCGGSGTCTTCGGYGELPASEAGKRRR